MANENYINHIALVLDASSSMDYYGHTQAVIKVADNQIKYLAQRSRELDQETRVTIYVFADTVTCLVYDKDVLRLPSIAELYRPYGNTALIDATNKALDDLEKTPELYGDHAFLVYVLTDGEENASHVSTKIYRSTNMLANELKARLTSLPEHWTVATFVPDANGVHEAKKFGFPADNIAVWNATSTKGIAEVGEVMRQVTDNYMTARTKGVRGTKTLFSMGADALNKQTVKDANLKPVPKTDYKLLDVKADSTIRDFVETNGLTFVRGQNYYQLTKTENVQKYKQIVVRNRKSGRIYTGPDARELLGLPDMDVRVKPEQNPEYQVFVQSTSVNRRLMAGTKLVVMGS